MTSEKNEPNVIIHAGVVKTASSYLQAILKRNSGRLRKAGVNYVHHRDTRKNYTVPCQLNAREKLGINFEPKVSDQELLEISRAFFRNQSAKDFQRLILSDENILGHSGHCARVGRLFTLRKMFAGVFAEHIPHPVTEVHFAIRNYASFYSSTYVEYLRSAQADRIVTENSMKKLVYSKHVSWEGVASVVLNTFPEADVFVWRFEDLSELSSTILQNLCGQEIDVSKFASPNRKRTRPSASQRAVEVLFNSIERFGADAALANWAKIQEQYPRGDEYQAYNPWTKDERIHLTNLYHHDVKQLASLPRVNFLSP
ncbi:MULTISPECIES: hypothetical protein [Halocynthiibacter]|uniref:Sulfotransferase domain-containing protein n=1 Tax=Halocynthiibacter halioticoli TaxID=2986804 RepID=A0AAE3J3I8_9RHOB|nr:MULTISPECIES: hypothetical protein [Halocynthiibacter]MCV6824777.1 hypothetical protein [Halocynthiibacter halioticoli]MCW4057778.1 hypothetical protein [Halocynthiibacter sp. SDUM655004]